MCLSQVTIVKTDLKLDMANWYLGKMRVCLSSIQFTANAFELADYTQNPCLVSFLDHQINLSTRVHHDGPPPGFTSPPYIHIRPNLS